MRRIVLACILISGCAHQDGNGSVVQSSTPPHTVQHIDPSKSTAPEKTYGTPFQRAVGRLQELGYLPLKDAYIHAKGHTEYHPFFMWRVPHALESTAIKYRWNWSNPFIRGAIVQFERENGILKSTGSSEGKMHKNVWSALFSGKSVRNKYPWQWVLVNKSDGTKDKESLHIWENDDGKGKFIWSTPVNTGVLHSTPDGTFIVYQRLPKTTMVGEFPIPVKSSAYKPDSTHYGVFNGSLVRWKHYDDHGILWVNYFDDGRGMHYYPRARYGFPQSAGCVEEPYKNSKITYKLLHYGVPVTISSSVFP